MRRAKIQPREGETVTLSCGCRRHEALLPPGRLGLLCSNAREMLSESERIRRTSSDPKKREQLVGLAVRLLQHCEVTPEWAERWVPHFASWMGVDHATMIDRLAA